MKDYKERGQNRKMIQQDMIKKIMKEIWIKIKMKDCMIEKDEKREHVR